MASVKVDLNYVHPSAERLVTFVHPIRQRNRPQTNLRHDNKRVTIHSARNKNFSLDVEGFQLVNQSIQGKTWEDFLDESYVNGSYIPGIIEHVKASYKAKEVVVFDYMLRDSTAMVPKSELIRLPLTRVHNDLTAKSASERVLRSFPPDEADERLKAKKFSLINIWRPITTVEQWPLAICDARTIQRTDLMTHDLAYRDWTDEIYALKFRPTHQWYWYPNQAPDEVILFKTFDARPDVARLAAHTAFRLPDAGDKHRYSIEVRAICFW